MTLYAMQAPISACRVVQMAGKPRLIVISFIGPAGDKAAARPQPLAADVSFIEGNGRGLRRRL